MFKSRRSLYYGKGKGRYYGKGKRRQSFSLFWSILSIPLALILLELMTRMLVSFSGQSQELSVYEGEPSKMTAYRLKFVTENEQSYDGLSDRGHLVAQRHLSLGYQLVGNQQNEFWQINEQGFRDSEPLPLAKPKNEVRIFILGNSTAFGQWNESNEQTITKKLESRLQKRIEQQKSSPEKYRPDVFPFYKPSRKKAFALPPKIRDGKYRVINAAIPGYTSGNELAQLTLKILPYEPDVIVILDGYGDLMLPSSKTLTDIPKLEEFSHNATGHFGAYLSHSLQQWLKDTYIVKASQYFVLKPEPTVTQKTLVVRADRNSLEEYLPKDEAELKLRLKRYQDNHKQILRLCTSASVPIVLVTQPEITSRPQNRLSDSEKVILGELGDNYKEKLTKYYPQFVESSKQLEKAFPKNVKVLNFDNLEQKLPSPAFVDAIHLTEEANAMIAEQLYYNITSLQKIQIIPKNLVL